MMEFCLDLLRSKFWLIGEWSITHEPNIGGGGLLHPDSKISVVYFTLLLSFVCFRNISLGVNSAWTRIGGMLSPQIFLLVSFLAFLCFMVRKWKLWNMGETIRC